MKIVNLYLESRLVFSGVPYRAAIKLNLSVKEVLQLNGLTAPRKKNFIEHYHLDDEGNPKRAFRPDRPHLTAYTVEIKDIN